MEEGKIKRSDIYLATKVNMMGLGTYPCGDRSGPHSYDAEIVMHACKVPPLHPPAPHPLNTLRSTACWPRRRPPPSFAALVLV